MVFWRPRAHGQSFPEKNGCPCCTLSSREGQHVRTKDIRQIGERETEK